MPQISTALLETILAHAAATPAVEVCGLLFGEGDRIAAARPATNVAADPARRFEIDPAALFAAMRAERNGGPRLIGHYHSHPNGDPAPSACDAALAQPGQLWLIVGGRAAATWIARTGGPIHGMFAGVPLEALPPPAA